MKRLSAASSIARRVTSPFLGVSFFIQSPINERTFVFILRISIFLSSPKIGMVKSIMLPFTTLEKKIREDLKYNLTVGLSDGGFFGLAIGFASFGTILPLFVASMTDSATLIGLVPAIHSAGWLLPQLFTANHTSRLRRYKRTVMFNTVHERLPFFGFAIVALLLPKLGLQTGLILTFLLLTWQGLGGGFTANPWTSMISKIFPPENHGTFFGTQAAVANLFISGAAVCAGYLLDYLDSPMDFAICFFIASVFFTISL